MSRWRRRLRTVMERFGLLAGGLVLSLLLAEGLVRLIMPQQLVVLRPDVWVSDDVLGWRRSANLDTTINTGERKVHLLTDDRGHRIGPGPQSEEAQFRVLALGDSFIEALQVEYEDSVSGLVERGLSQHLGATVRVDDTGVAGYGPNHYLIQARTELQRTHYDAVLVFLFLGNDVEFERQERFKPKTPETRHDFHWPRSLSPSELISAVLYPANDVLERHSHVFVLLRKRLPFIKNRLVAIRHAGKKNSTDPASIFRLMVINRELDSSPRWRLTAEICADIAAAGRAQGIPTLFVLLPQKSWIDPEALVAEARGLGIEPALMDTEQPFRHMTQELSALGLENLSTLEAFRSSWRSGETHLFGQVDTHLSPTGHRLLASLVLPRLVEALGDEEMQRAAEHPRP